MRGFITALGCIGLLALVGCLGGAGGGCHLISRTDDC